jgi:retron-type reverse transcriptase
LALDPVLETNADRNSYGFRQKRCCADAIEQCFITLSKSPNTQWILEADIKSGFDQISSEWSFYVATMISRIGPSVFSDRTEFPVSKAEPLAG